MRIKFGDTEKIRYEKKMILRDEQKKWHRYFAWFPTRFGEKNEGVWLGYCLRRSLRKDGEWTWEYMDYGDRI